MSDITIVIDTKTRAGYDKFIQCKRLPKYKVVRNTIITDEKSFEYVFGSGATQDAIYSPHKIAFDYQEYVIKRALERERYAAFLDCGLGKTIIELIYSKSVVDACGGKALFVCPLTVMEDIQRECKKLYGFRMDNLRTEEFKNDFGIINYESRKDIDVRGVRSIVLDEASILKSGDGETSKWIMDISKNIRFRLSCSATPSPNDQTEYASQAVFLGISNTLKEFYSKFFVKDGTEWRMKDHAKDAFYDFLRSWACYIQSPSSIGFERGAELKNEPNYIIQDSYPIGDYYQAGTFISTGTDLATARKVFGVLRADKSQDRFNLAVESIYERRGIVWCSRNAEEDAFKSELGAKSINGSTPIEERVEIVDAFKSGQIKHIVSKPSVLGFGVNIQEAEANLFSGYTFSFEQFYQAIRRSHRYGRKGRLDVIVPVSEPERPVWEILQRKLATFKNDVAELQKRFFINT
jgi:hypothetical protein